MKNTLLDLNNHLFEQLERLNDEDLTEEQLDAELKRADGMTRIAAQIIQNGELAYKTMVHMDEYGYGLERNRQVPAMLDTGGGDSINDLEVSAGSPRPGKRVGAKAPRQRAGRADQ